MKMFLKFALKPFWKYIFVILVIVGFQTYFQLEIVRIFSSSLYYLEALDIGDVTVNWVWMLVFTLLSFVCMFFVTFLSTEVSVRVAKRTRLKLFHIYNGLSSLELSEVNNTGLMSRATRGVYTEQGFVSFVLKFLLIVPFVFFGVLLSFSNFIFCMLFLFFVVFTFIFLYFRLKVLIDFYFKAKKTYGRINFFFRGLILGSKHVRSFDKSDFEEDKYEEVLVNSYNKNIDFELNGYYLSPLVLFIFDLFIFIILAVLSLGFDFKIFSNLSVVSAIGDIQYVLLFISFLNFLPSFVDKFPRAYASSVRIEEVLSLEKRGVSSGDSILKSDFKGVEFRDVSFEVEGRSIISNVSFKVPSGSSVAIVGGISSGKTSLMYLLDGLYDLTDGEILIDGVSIKDFNPCSKIAFAMQKDFILNLSIYDNLTLGDESISYEDVCYASGLTGLDKLFKDYDFSFDTVLYENGSNISAGFKKKIILTRCILKDKDIYIFDEFDFKVKDRTNFIVTRDISKIKDISNIIVLGDGKLVGEGSHSQLIENCKEYQELLKGELL